jgi:hypothetical protein
MGDAVDEFLSQHVPRECYEIVTESDRIRCLVTGHEMARSVQAIKSHFEGRKFKAKAGKWKPAFNFAQYEPHIVEDRSNPKHFLYCRITRSTIPRLAGSVEAHVNGRRYQNALLLQEQRGGGNEDEDLEEDDVDVDPSEMADVMRDDVDVMWGDEKEGDEEVEEDQEEEPSGRELIELEKDIFVFRGRKKRKKGSK